MKTTLLSLASLALFFAPPSAKSAIILSDSALPPPHSFISNPPAAGFTSGFNNNYTNSLGQQFQSASAFVLDQIVIYTGAAVPAAFNFTLHIEKFASNAITSTRTSVSTQTGTSKVIHSGNRYLTFDIENVAIEANTMYGFRLTIDAAAPTHYFQLTTDTKSAYSAGATYYITNPSTAPVVHSYSNDLVFHLVAIPEPAHLLLLGGGLLLLVANRRRRTHCA